MTYRQRLSLFIIIDSLIIFTAIFMGWFLVNENINIITPPLMIGFISILASHQIFSVLFKLYKKAWEYASIGELLIIFKVVTYSILVAVVMQQLVFQEVYARLLMVTWLLHLLLMGGSRFIWRMYRDSIMGLQDNKIRTLIIGAGSAGTMVGRQLLNNNQSNLLPVAFIDDNVKKQQLDILGIPVLGGVNDIVAIVQKLTIDNIVISIPSLSKRELNVIFRECAKTNAKTKILPLLEDLVTGKISVEEFRDVRVEDLLARDPVDIDIASISEYITNKTVLVTGAGGSIGSEISRQIATFDPRQLVLLGHGENSIYTIEMELKERYKDRKIVFRTEIADVQNAEKMMDIMRIYQPDVVYHTAAHKHVPLMERNPEEAVKNNIIGTMNISRAAGWNGVKTFVMVSTDKAVNPTSVMGATKKIAEMIIQRMDTHSKTRFVTVRFGNVLGSRGSVIPLFKKQIERGGPVTVTHPEMVRYFMTIPEASKLVIQAGALANGGEIFVLDMGEPVKIVDLAKNLIKLSGNTIDDIGLKFTGIRAGEKLFEELLKEDEILEQQLYPKIHIGKTTEFRWAEIEGILSNYAKLDKDALRKRLITVANNDVIGEPKSFII